MNNEELLAKIEAIESDPKNHNPEGSFYLYTAAARKRLDKLRMAVASNIRAAKIARGEYVNDEGYSGRNSKRRK